MLLSVRPMNILTLGSEKIELYFLYFFSKEYIKPMVLMKYT